MFKGLITVAIFVAFLCGFVTGLVFMSKASFYGQLLCESSGPGQVACIMRAVP